MQASKNRYIPALDGLRAFAVLSVIVYHFGFRWASGGLLGVTIFFVLSGYLITSLLLSEFAQTKTIDLKAFWMRRAKRLFPAIVFLIACTIVLCALFSQNLLTKMRPDIPSALFFYSNWWYIFRDVSYFETLGAPSPLTHFWSLAIEEQFYLIWPPVLFFLFSKKTRKRTIMRIILVLIIASVVLMAILYSPNADPSRVYYGTDTRAFSLLIGVLLAFVWSGKRRREARHSNPSLRGTIVINTVGIGAFIGLVAMVVFASGFSPLMYRGGILFASLLTAVLIAALIHPKSVIAKAAAIPPLVWIGKCSYGMYLWHYPIILLMTPANFTGERAWWFYLLQLALIFGISFFSYRFIENPIRKGALGKFWTDISERSIGLFKASKKRFVPLVSTTALLACATVLFVIIEPTPSADFLTAQGNMAGTNRLGQPKDLAFVDETIQAATDNPLERGILLIGDSVALGASPLLEATFPNSIIDADVSRQLYEGHLAYEEHIGLGEERDIVVFVLGTNGVAVDDQIDYLMGFVGAEKAVFFVNTRSPQFWVPTTNDTLNRATERYENTHVIDWFSLSAGHDDWLVDDGIHLTEEGVEAFVEMIRTALDPPKQNETKQ
ncbi:MAG: acetyltransferase [Eggerthellaceae bacterium]|nr:acetyltransferase [Eggerthellaceae bacterium]